MGTESALVIINAVFQSICRHVVSNICVSVRTLIQTFCWRLRINTVAHLFLSLIIRTSAASHDRLNKRSIWETVVSLLTQQDNREVHRPKGNTPQLPAKWHAVYFLSMSAHIYQCSSTKPKGRAHRYIYERCCPEAKGWRGVKDEQN